MSALTVGTDPVEVVDAVGRGRPIIQNLGPGKVYFDFDEDVSVDSGIELPVGAAFEFSQDVGPDGALFVVADQADTDVRVTVLGIK